MSKGFWRGVRNFAALAAVPLLLMQAWDWISRPSEKLTLDLHFGSLQIPPMIRGELDDLYDLLDPDTLPGEINLEEVLGGPPSEEDKKIAERTLNAVSRRFQYEKVKSIQKGFHNLTGYWLATIVNSGSKSLEGIVVTLPDAEYASIQREGADPIVRGSTDVIEIGSMRPREVVSVTAWTRSAVPFLGFAKERVKITHDNGIGSVSIYAPVGRVGQFVDKLMGLGPGFLIWILFLTGFAILWIYLNLRESRQPKSDDGPPPKKTAKEAG